MLTMKFASLQILLIFKIINFAFGVEDTNKCLFSSHDNFSSWQKDFIPNGYDRNSPPLIEGGRTSISVGLLPMGIPDMNVEKMTLNVDFYISLIWKDCRLNSIPPTLTSLPVELSNKIWIPSAHFRNGVGALPLKFNRKLHKIFIYKESFVYYSRLDVPFNCKYDLSAYPMDKQRCELHIISDINEKLIEFKHFESELQVKAVKEWAPPQSVVTDVGKGNCNFSDLYTLQSPCVALYIVLERALLFHLMVTYVPSCLIVILSWMSFWLDVDASAPRVTLGLTSLLTLSTQFANVQKSLPQVSYIKAVDVWMFTCMFMVFASLIEFAVANSSNRRNSDKQDSRPNIIRKPNLNHKVYVVQVSGSEEKMHQRSKLNLPSKDKEEKKIVNIIDKIARLAFPLSFLLFNIIYWSFYLTFYN